MTLIDSKSNDIADLERAANVILRALDSRGIGGVSVRLEPQWCPPPSTAHIFTEVITRRNDDDIDTRCTLM